MPVVSRPRQHLVLSLTILVAIPIFFLNVWVLQKGAIAKVLQREMLVWMSAQAVWVLVSMYWLLKATWRGFWSTTALASAMFGLNVYYLVFTKNYALAFYGLFLLIIAGLYCLHLFRSLKEPYYSPGQQWFEGRPIFLPRIEAELRAGTRQLSARLSRLGIEGCFAYPRQLGLDADGIESIELKLGDLRFSCAVELISRTKDGAGRGFRFVASSPDQNKEIRDFIDRVRSAGYVS